MPLRCRLAIAVLCSPLVVAAQGSNGPEREYAGSDIGLVEIRCDLGDAGTTRRRGVLLDTRADRARFEIVLTAAHGFPTDSAELLRICALAVDEDTSFPVAREWRAPRTGGGYRDDWAVLLINGRLEGEVERLPLAPVGRRELREQLSSDAEVRLPLRFAPTERPCELLQSRLTPDEIASGILAHNCVSWLGHSGSPILVDLNGVTYVLGLHVGSRWVFETSEALRLGRYVDESVSHAVDAAIEAGRRLEPPEAERGLLRRLFGW